LPQDRRGAWRESAAALEDIILSVVRGGDLVIVKGSNASKMSAIVAALKTRYSGETVSP
jgi:UDP-N-acetylmuramoyl-tripeptide--D-alanyl-D-alanine ligase